MARTTENQKDKALWLTLAQSFVRLAEHVERRDQGGQGIDGEERILAVHSSD